MAARGDVDGSRDRDSLQMCLAPGDPANAAETQQPAEPDERECGMSVRAFKTLVGVAIVVGIAFSWVSATQFAQSTYSSTFNAPYFTTWFSTAWMVIVFPVYFLPSLFRGREYRLALFRESQTIFGPQGLTVKLLFTRVGPFCLLWMLTNYLYIRALGIIHAADVTALFSSSNAFVYVFSWFWLKERISVIKISAVVLSIGGIVLMAYAEGFGGANAIGVVLSVAAALGAALYKVLFKRFVGDATGTQVSLFLTCLGFLNIFILWPIVMIFHFTQYELIDWSNMPWLFLNGTGIVVLLFNFLINFGIALTYPLFISIGTVLGIPINAGADAVFRGADFGKYKIIAACLIVIGFVFMLLPDHYEDKLLRRTQTDKDGDLPLDYVEVDRATDS